MKIIILSLLLCVGCSSTFRRLPVVQARVLESAREEASATGLAVEQVRRDVGAARALSPDNAPLASADWSAAMAARLAGRAEALLGPPAIDQSSRMESMLSTNASERAQSQAREQARESLQSADLRAQRSQEATLIEKGKIYETEHNQSIVRRVWGWIIGSVGILGVVALCFLCPPAISVFGTALGWLISKIPQISSFIGLVGKRSYERAVTAIQEIKEKSKAAGKDEISDFAQKVAVENTSKDSALVAHVKDKLDY